jgi:hypothetical protein
VRDNSSGMKTLLCQMEITMGTLWNIWLTNSLKNRDPFTILSGKTLGQWGALTTIAANSVENWPSLLHTSGEIEIDAAAEQIQEVRYFLLLCYFTDRPPQLPAFRDWVHTEMNHSRGWPVKQVKFTGKNFFLIVFEESHHRDAARDCAPWFMDGHFVYTFEWTPDFDVRTESYTKLPVWIELPFCTLILEKSMIQIAETLGEILYYIQGEELSLYPHDRVCILWDTTQEVPMSIRVGIKGYKDLAIWQPVLFKNIPYHCFRCNGKGHLARECQEFEAQAASQPIGVISDPPVDLFQDAAPAAPEDKDIDANQGDKQEPHPTGNTDNLHNGRSYSPRPLPPSQVTGETKGAHSSQLQITPQATTFMGNQIGAFAGSSRTVQDNIGGNQTHGHTLPPVGVNAEVSAHPDTGIDDNSLEELLPRQHLGDVDQLQYSNLMTSREKDRADRTRKLDTCSPVTGHTKAQMTNKFLKNHPALDFDNVSNMQVENTPGSTSLVARVSHNLSSSSSPTGSVGKGNSRMEDADALQ